MKHPGCPLAMFNDYNPFISNELCSYCKDGPVNAYNLGFPADKG
jgi:hypothetical protein